MGTARSRCSVALVRVAGADSNEIHIADYNVGLRYLASAAEDAGAVVEILDPLDGRNTDDVVERLQHDIVGFTVHHLNTLDTLVLVRALKRYRPKTFVILGGHHASATAYELLRDVPEVDAVCATGGEDVIARVVQRLLIPSSREHAVGCLVGQEKELLDEQKYPGPPVRGNIARISTSRGCPFECSFCTTPAMRRLWKENSYLVRSPQSILDECEMLYAHGIRSIRFNDDLYIVPSHQSRSRATAVADLLISKGLPIHYKVEYRCDSVPLDGLDMLKRLRLSGLREVFLGVESGSDQILQEYRKNLAFQTSVAAVRLHEEAGIVVNAGNILISPSTTTRALVSSIQGFHRLGLAYLLFRRSNFRAHVFPGTEMEHRLQAEGRLTRSARYAPASYLCGERRIDDVADLLESAMPLFFKRTQGEAFIGRTQALQSLYDGRIEARGLMELLGDMNQASTDFLLRWFRDLPACAITARRFTTEMDEFTKAFCKWGKELIQLTK